jgi:hypothetical protein
MSDTTNEPSREPTFKPTNDQTTNQVKPSSTFNISYTFEAVNGVSHFHIKYILNNQADASQPTGAKTSDGDEVNNVIIDHNKHIVTGQVTFSDRRDSEIQSMCPDLSLPQTNKINLDSTSFKKINRSSTHACLVLFSSFSAIGTELKHGVHPHQVLVTSSSKPGLQRNKNSERVRGNASTQPCGLCHDKKIRASWR